jgi:hypothetical protein
MNWDAFWSVLVVVPIIVPLFIIWGFAVTDLFARSDLGGLAKVLWLFAIIFFPIVGTLVYYIPAAAQMLYERDRRTAGGFYAVRVGDGVWVQTSNNSR